MKTVIKSRVPKMAIIIFLVALIVSFFGYYRLADYIVYPAVPVEIEAKFLSEAYFSQLSEQYARIRSEYRRWYLFDHSKSIAAHAILVRMMSDLRKQPEALDGHDHFERFFDTFDRAVRQLPYTTEEIHYFRNELNRYGEAPERLEEMVELAACGKWRLYSARYHRYEVKELDAAYQVKFISDNGRFEAVYHTETGQIVTDPVNMGTYNYAPGSIYPWKDILHHQYDKLPWMKWGNTNQVSYEEIVQRKTRHGSIEQQTNTEELQQLIRSRMLELQEDRLSNLLCQVVWRSP
ncbi:hypothetical protein M6D81_25235 [Paenibacillus sp. J5C_2022]|uniref:hypothetical protein n=1 Tax=Paenibacillus sp. J5C2022 TaxID=2977129 RepID=UPI0021D310F5|nr:hypothetical protein [Paenibacillus sp. J5C2022]MCU6712012.1 hypothetical protein [Paenibacillus sp. J5C2022]